jgi:hypothetical protein
MANKPKRISEGQYLLLEYIKNFGHLEIVQRSLLEGFECRLHELEYSAFTEKETMTLQEKEEINNKIAILSNGILRIQYLLQK